MPRPPLGGRRIFATGRQRWRPALGSDKSAKRARRCGEGVRSLGDGQDAEERRAGVVAAKHAAGAGAAKFRMSERPTGRHYLCKAPGWITGTAPPKGRQLGTQREYASGRAGRLSVSRVAEPCPADSLTL